MNSSTKRDYILTEQGTEQYADLDMAQTVALAAVTQALVTTLRAKRNNENKEATNSHDEDE